MLVLDMGRWGTRLLNILIFLLKVTKGVLKANWLKEGKCNKVPKLKKVDPVAIGSMLCMLHNRMGSLPMWLWMR